MNVVAPSGLLRPSVAVLDEAVTEQIQKRSYAQILKSTAVIGGSSVITIAVSIARNKAMAVILGPAGVGLMGLFTSVAELAQSLAGMGVQSSGVRQIAEAVGSGDAERVARTAAVLRRVSVALGLLGALLLVAFAHPISILTFGDASRTGGIALLSLAVLFRLVSAGQSALIQGMRRIGDLASQNVLAAVLGTITSVGLVVALGERGVVPSLIGVWAATLFASWFYSRRVSIARPTLSASTVIAETASLLKLGSAFMASAFLTMGAGYAIRIIVLRHAGIAASGLYQAAWALGGLYVGFILQAMGADFYPRLTAVHRDNAACTRLVNEQAQISLLLAGPGVLATLTFAPLVMAIFYSAQFGDAVVLLRWICLGMTLRVVAWPMGFVILAKGAQQVYFWTEVAATIVHVGLAWVLVRNVGVNGAGVAFFGLYVWHTVLIYAIVARISSFRWSSANRQLGAIYLPTTAAVFLGVWFLPRSLSIVLGSVATVATCVYSIRTLVRLLPEESLPSGLGPWLRRLGFRIDSPPAKDGQA